MCHGEPVGKRQAPREDKAASYWGLFRLRNFGENKVFFLVAFKEHLQAHLQEARAEPPALILNPIPTSSLARRAVCNPAVPFSWALTHTHGQENRMLPMMILSCCALSTPTAFATPILLHK